MMPDSVRAEILRFRRWEDRQASLFGKLLLLHALRCNGQDQGSAILERLEYTETGKPFIRGAGDFNISHSGGCVALALAADGEVGIDVEIIRSIQIADFSRYLPEIPALETSDPSLSQNMFYACWTKKEAVLKGDGSGLMAPLEQVTLQGDTSLFHERQWHLREIDCGAAYCCHAATSIHQSCCRIKVVNF
ncbi:MAG: 4'-phosphopantetheinyl transferase superfamily protein [Pedobacter sp.]